MVKKIYPTQLSGKTKVHDLMPRSLKCIFHEFIFVSKKKKKMFFSLYNINFIRIIELRVKCKLQQRFIKGINMGWGGMRGSRWCYKSLRLESKRREEDVLVFLLLASSRLKRKEKSSSVIKSSLSVE